MKRVISILISIIIFCVTLIFLIEPKKDFSYNENRYLTKPPILNIDNIISGKFMTQLDDYIADNFPFRENLLSFKSKLYKKIGMYKQNDVYYGYDNKLYQEYKKPNNNDTIIRRVNKLSENINSNIYFMLIPTSIYVNNNKISKYNTSFDESKTIDYYKENLNVNFIDVRETFNKNKDKYLYYGPDHHWTTRGANFAYLEYCKNVKIKCQQYNFSIVNDNFYGTLYSKVLDNSLEHDYIEKVNDDTNYYVYFDDSKNYTNSLYNYKYLNEKDKYSFFLDNNHSLITIENLDTQNNNSILVIKDSYANAFIPLIAHDYKYIYVIDPRYYNSSISDYINKNQINEVLFIYNVLTIDDDLGIAGIK